MPLELALILRWLVHLDAVLLLAAVQILARIYTRRGVLDLVLDQLRRRLRSRKLFLVIVSAVLGILPIPGRISVASGVLDTLRPPDQPAPELGVVAYLASHHYYLWSPLEKSVILSLAGLGISYQTFLGWVAGPLLLVLGLTVAYIYLAVPETRIRWSPAEAPPPGAGRGLDLALFGLAFLAAILGASAGLAFGAVAALTVARHRVPRAEVRAALDLPLLGLVAVVVALGQLLNRYADDLQAWFEALAAGGIPLAAAGLITFALTALLGSSARYAALAVAAAALYGPETFVFFFLVDYAGYVISPTHKCIWIGQRYFQTPLRQFAPPLGLVAAGVLIYAALAAAAL